MKYTKEVMMVLVLFLLIGNVSADDYDITLTILRPDTNDYDNTTWSKYDTITVDKDERVVSIYNIMVEDIALSSETVVIEVIEDGERVVIFIKVGESEIFEFEDSDSPPIKIKVDSIEEGGSSSSTTAVSEEDDVVRIWVAPNSLDELCLTKDASIPDAYNPSEFGKTSGWSGSGSIEYVVMYIERLENAGGITVTIEGGDWDEIRINDDDKRKYELNENAVYTITVEYEELDSWGGVKDEVEVYKLSVTGLLYGINTDSGNPLTTNIAYEDRTIESFNSEIDKYIIVETDSQGVWEEVDGAVIKLDGETTSGTISWKIKLDSAGTHRIGFREADGSSGYYRFLIKEIAPVATVAANQVTSDSDDESNSGTVVLILGGLILIGAAAIFLNKKNRDKKGGNNGNTRTSPALET